mgnify:FL=1
MVYVNSAETWRVEPPVPRAGQYVIAEWIRRTEDTTVGTKEIRSLIQNPEQCLCDDITHCWIVTYLSLTPSSRVFRYVQIYNGTWDL